MSANSRQIRQSDAFGRQIPQMNASRRHTSVLETTVLALFSPANGESVLDCTLGMAGHAMQFLEKIGKSGFLTGLDADAQNLALAKEVLAPYNDQIRLIHTNFGSLPELGLELQDCIFADLGLSSLHLDEAERGFSFRLDGPLDLRFDRSQGETAADLLERLDDVALRDIFRRYGELRDAPRLARRIAGQRFDTTTQLREAVEEVMGFRAPRVLPQVFQAIRIALNDELSALDTLLDTAPGLLKSGGRLGIISFHSLEDRMVKHAFRALCEPEKDSLTGQITRHAPFELLTKKAVVPSDEEVASNPRARSAKFRVLRRLP